MILPQVEYEARWMFAASRREGSAPKPIDPEGFLELSEPPVHFLLPRTIENALTVASSRRLLRIQRENITFTGGDVAVPPTWGTPTSPLLF